MTHEKKITQEAGRVALGTTVSRILGYLRDMFVAHAFGAGLMADAFYAAFRIPNLLRRLFGEGALSASFIPVLSEYLHTKSKEETQYFINVLFTALLIIVTVLTIIGIIFSPELVNVIAYGFSSQGEKLELTVSLTRLMFPFMAFVCLAALVMGILNTFSSFFLAAVAPASLSVAEIAYVLAIAPLLSPDNKVKGLALSVVVGGIGHFLVQIPKLKKLGWELKFVVDFKHPAIKRIVLLMIPATLGLSVDQINAFVNTMCASFLREGSITALYYSNRIMQLPLAIFGIALASVSLPAMSKAIAQNDRDTLKTTLNFSLNFVHYILIPSAVGLMAIGIPIIQVLFERGRFDHNATLMTNSAMFYYSLGLPAYASAKLFANVFYSMKDTKTPVKAAVIAMLLNIVLMILLMKKMEVGGLALAAAVSSWANAAILAYLVQKRLGIIDIKSLALTSIKTVAASLVMGASSYYIAVKMFKNLTVGLTCSIAAGLVLYYVCSKILGLNERKLFVEALRKKIVK